MVKIFFPTKRQRLPVLVAAWVDGQPLKPQHCGWVRDVTTDSSKKKKDN